MGTDKQRAVLLGAGGHAKVVLEALRAAQEVDVVGALDRSDLSAGSKPEDRTVIGLPVLGEDELLPALFEDGVRCAAIGVGSIGPPRLRRRLAATLESLGFDVLTVVHPRAYVSPSARLATGAQVMPMAVVHAEATIGEHAIVNTGAIVEHDAVVGAFAHVAPGARLAGGVRVGEGAHIGIGATVREGISVGAGAIVGAGAVVVRDVQDNVTVTGVPARPLERS